MAQRRAPGLRREVSLAAVAGTIFGNIAAAVFLALGVTARDALGVTPLVFIAAGIVLLMTLPGYIEGIAMVPQAGGSSGFAREGFNDFVSFLCGWALLLDYMIVIAMSAFFASHYIAALPGLERIADSPADVIVSVVLIVVVALVNSQQVSLGARLYVVISLLAVVAQVALAILGWVLVFHPHLLSETVEIGTSPTWSQLAFALPVAMIGFAGLDVVANLSGELRDPGNQLPRPFLYSGLTAVLMLVVISIVGLSALPVHIVDGHATTALGTTWVDRPLIGIIQALPISDAAESVLHAVFGTIAALVLFLVAATTMAGLSRLVYSMSVNRQLPGMLARIDRDEGAPVVGVVLLSVATAGLLVVTSTIKSSAIVLAQLYAFGAMFSFMVAGAALIRLRLRRPDLARPFRAPLNVRLSDGREVSVVMVAALLLAAIMWALVLLTHDAARTIGIIWMTFGFVLYSAYRLTHGLSLTRRAEQREVVAFQISAHPYRKALIAVRPERGKLWGAGDAEVASLAHKLLDSDADLGELAVMLVHELPLTKPLNAPLGSIEQVTTERLALLRRSTDKLGVRMTTTIARARAAGRAICQEAARRNVDVVVLATRRKPRAADAVFGRTVAYVLRHAPCDVVVMSFPAGSLAGDERRGAGQAEAGSRPVSTGSH